MQHRGLTTTFTHIHSNSWYVLLFLSTRIVQTSSVLPEECIHHIDNPAECPYCHQYDTHFAGQDPDQDTEEEKEERKRLEEHQQLAHNQRNAFFQDMQHLRQGTNNQHIVIVHNFSRSTLLSTTTKTISLWLMNEPREVEHDIEPFTSLLLIIWRITMRNL